MPFVLRTISKAKWFPLEASPSQDQQRISESIQSDAFSDIKTEGNKLSVWHIEDNRSNLDRVLTALAANRDVLANVDYVILSEESIKSLKIEIEESQGESPDKDVNAWHRDLNIRSGSNLFALASAIFSMNDSRIRKPRKEVEKLLCNAVRNGLIDAT